jgi:pentatricopeptide repeat protein
VEKGTGTITVGKHNKPVQIRFACVYVLVLTNHLLPIFLEKMRDEGMSVNLITYNAAITALSKASRRNSKNGVKYNRNQLPSGSKDEGLWTRVVMLLQQMKEDGIQPDGFSFTSAISCCGAEGRWEEALELMAVMKKGGPRTRPNKIAYTAAICKCVFVAFSKVLHRCFLRNPYAYMKST